MHRPCLRPVETIFVRDPRQGRVLVLRDTQGVTEAQVSVPLELVPIVARFTGQSTCEEIARDASMELGVEVPLAVVTRLAEDLDRALFLRGKTFEAARKRVESEFAVADVRAATHAGGAYSANAHELGRYIEDRCVGAAAPVKNGVRGHLSALIAPHIDPWRGAVSYGHAYGTMGLYLPEDVDTFVVFGTSHAPMREHFALCRKAFDTPLGAVKADDEAIDRIAAAAPFDPYADQFNHKREHSLEFQIVFLKHLLGERPIRIVPILAGLGEHQARGTDPGRDDHANRFLEEVADVVSWRNAIVVAGADLAHVGPRFGDAEAYDEKARTKLEARDRASLTHAADGDADGFWGQVVEDLETRRVCGLGPIYAMLRTMRQGAHGKLFHYEQTIDAGDGSIVSHAALGFFGDGERAKGGAEIRLTTKRRQSI